MKSKLFIGTGILLLTIGAYAENNITLLALGLCGVIAGLSGLYAISAGVEFTGSHYRIYKRYFGLKTGQWKTIKGIRRIYIREYVYENHSRKPFHFFPEAHELVVVEYRLYLVRKSGYYKIFSSNSLERTRRKAHELSSQYNLPVEESKRLVQA